MSRQFARIVPSSAAPWIVALLALCLASACDRGADASRSLLASRRTGWERARSTLRQEREALQRRFAGLPLDNDAPALDAQMRATLDGARQSLADVDVQIGQAAPRFEQAVAHGELPDQVVDRECGRVDRYLQTMSEQLAEAGRRLDGFEQDRMKSASR